MMNIMISYSEHDEDDDNKNNNNDDNDDDDKFLSFLNSFNHNVNKSEAEKSRKSCLNPLRAVDVKEPCEIVSNSSR